MRLHQVWWIVPSLLAASLGAQWRDLTGQAVPELTADDWFNTGDHKPTRESLQGKLWVLEFFATWCGPCMAKVEYLSKLHDKYFDLGFRVVAVSDESRNKLHDMIESRKASYWIASDRGNGTRARFLTGDDYGIPQFYVIDASGCVVEAGLPSEERIVELLEAGYAEVGQVMPAELQTAERAYLDGAYGEAWRLAGEAMQSESVVVREAASFLRQRVEDHGAFIAKTLPGWLEGKRPEQAYGRLLLLSYQFERLDAASSVNQKLAEMAKDAAVKKESKVWRQLAEAIERDLGSQGKEYERKRAREMYAAILEKSRYSRAAELAKQRLARFDAAK